MIAWWTTRGSGGHCGSCGGDAASARSISRLRPACHRRPFRWPSAATSARCRSPPFDVCSRRWMRGSKASCCGAAGRSIGCSTSATRTSWGRASRDSRLSVGGVVVEATYSVYGERGSIDVLAGHDPTRSLLVEEVKSELTSVEAVGRKTDEKLRLARRMLCRERFGWAPIAAARVLVLPATDTARRSVARHAAILDAAFPARGREVTRWLRRPAGELSGVLFVSDTSGRDGSGPQGGSQRVRRRSTPSARA